MLLARTVQHLGKDVPAIILPSTDSAAARAAGGRVQDALLLLGYAVSALIALGLLVRAVREGLPPSTFFAGTYLAAIFVVWFWQGPRLLYPILPELLLGFLVGAQALIRGAGWLGGRAGRASSGRRASFAVAGLAVALLALSAYRGLDAVGPLPPAGGLSARTSWLSANTERDAVIMSEAHEVDYLYSGRKTIPFPVLRQTTETVELYLAEHGPDYVLIAPEPPFAWVPDGAPQYTQNTQLILRELERLAERGEVARVYDSGPALLQVFKRTSSAPSLREQRAQRTSAKRAAPAGE